MTSPVSRICNGHYASLGREVGRAWTTVHTTTSRKVRRQFILSVVDVHMFTAVHRQINPIRRFTWERARNEHR